jgi:transposase InsO family protein
MKCSTCSKGGGQIVNTKNRIINIKKPNKLWVIDLIGRLKGNNGTNKFIFVAIDHYTKWIETGELLDKSGKEIAKLIEELIINKHGIPTNILTDNGLEFKNREIEKLKAKFNITWIYSSPGHHETVGAVERVNQTLINKLKKLTDFGSLDWEDFLAQATRAVNFSYNRALRTTPFCFKYGKTPALEIDKKLNVASKTYSRRDLSQNRDEHFERYAKINIEKGKKPVRNDYKKGDCVLVYRETI